MSRPTPIPPAVPYTTLPAGPGLGGAAADTIVVSV